MKKWYFSICTKGFFTIYRVTYVMLLHDNASTLRGLTCLILWLMYCKFQEIIVYKIHPGGGGQGSIASLRSIRSKYVKHFYFNGKPPRKGAAYTAFKTWILQRGIAWYRFWCQIVTAPECLKVRFSSGFDSEHIFLRDMRSWDLNTRDIQLIKPIL